MITDIPISDNIEYVFDLSSIGLSGELVISKSGSYIFTDTDYYPVDKYLTNLKLNAENKFSLTYEEEMDEHTEEGKSEILLTVDQVKAIKEALDLIKL